MTGQTEASLAGRPAARLAGDAEVIPLDRVRTARIGTVLPRLGVIPASVLARMESMTPEQWIAHCDALERATEEQTAREAAETRRANRHASYLRRRNPHYAGARYEQLTPAQQHNGKVARWWSSPKKPRSLLLAGLSRRGKTTAGYAIANEAHGSGAWVEVFTEVDLADQLKGDNADAVWSRVTNCELLFLDDWGRGRATDWWKERLQQLLDVRFARARDGLRLLVAANTPRDLSEAYAELIDRYGDPIVERVIDNGGAILMFDGPRMRTMVEDW